MRGVKEVEAIPEAVRVGAQIKYPWDTLLDGKLRRIDPVVAFDATPQAFKMAARDYSIRHGIQIEVAVRRGFVYLRKTGG